MRVSLENIDEISVTGLYGYDFGQILEIEGAELPEGFEVHFQNGTGSPITVAGTYDSENEVGIVPIPDECLQQEVNSFNAWLWVEDEKSGKTLKTITFYLQQREKPSNIPPIGSVTEIKGYADYVKENAEKVTEAEQTANEAKKLAEKVKQLAEMLNNTDSLKIFAAVDSESAYSFIEEMYADFSANTPVLFMPLFDDDELGMQNGQGMIVVDSGTGQFDDAVIIPMSYSEYPFTSNLNEQLEKTNSFVNMYGYYYSPKPIMVPGTASGGYVCINQVNGEAFSEYKPQKFMLSVTVPSGKSTYRIAFNSTVRAKSIDLSPVTSDTSDTSLSIEAELINTSVLLRVNMTSDKGSSYYSTMLSISANVIFALYLEKDSNITINYAFGRR